MIHFHTPQPIAALIRRVENGKTTAHDAQAVRDLWLALCAATARQQATDADDDAQDNRVEGST